MSSRPISARAILDSASAKDLHSASGVTHAVLDIMLSLTDPSDEVSVEIGIKTGSTTTWLIKNILLDEIESVKTVEKLVLRVGQTVVARRTSGDINVSVLVSGLEEQNPVVHVNSTGLLNSGTSASTTLINCYTAPQSSVIEYMNTMVTIHNPNANTPTIVRIFNLPTTTPADADASVVVSVDPKDTIIINNIILKPLDILSLKSTGASVDWGAIGVGIISQP